MAEGSLGEVIPSVTRLSPDTELEGGFGVFVGVLEGDLREGV